MEDQTDELRARFTVFIKQLIIHAKISYLRQLKKASIDISFEEMENIPVQDFDDQYKEFTKERLTIKSQALKMSGGEKDGSKRV